MQRGVRFRADNALHLACAHDFDEVAHLVAGAGAEFEHGAVGAREEAGDVGGLVWGEGHLRADGVPEVAEPGGLEGVRGEDEEGVGEEGAGEGEEGEGEEVEGAEEVEEAGGEGVGLGWRWGHGGGGGVSGA